MWAELAEYGRWAPSPHNTQPTRLRIVDANRAELYFVPGRGLPVADPRGRFTYLTFGIFAETLRIAAHARGYDIDVSFADGPLYDGASSAPRKVADLRLVPRDGPIEDFDPELILRRRTNRRPFDGRPVPAGVIDALRNEAAAFGHTFTIGTDAAAIRWVKELNRDSLFHDLEHDRYREELGSWLRYSEAEARRRHDGLSPRALMLPGWLMKGVMRHHRLFSTAGIKPLTRQLYMRTMTGVPTVAWLQGDFVDVADWTRAGQVMARLWLLLTQHGVDWQPYGSVITNDEARAAMVRRFDIREPEDGRDMVWLLCRLGYSTRAPSRSDRLPLAEVVL